MVALPRLRRPKADLDLQQLPEGPGVLVVYFDDKEADAVTLGHLLPQVADELHRLGRQDLLVVACHRGMSLEVLDQGDMAHHGWVRRQDRQVHG